MVLKACLQTLFAYISTICFGVITNIPRRAFNVAGIIGGLSWLVYWILYYHLHWGLAVSNMIAAILIAILSMGATRHTENAHYYLHCPGPGHLCARVGRLIRWCAIL